MSAKDLKKILDRKPQRNSEVRWKFDVDKVVLFVPNSRQLLTLNFLGGVIWQLSDGKNTVKDIISLLSKQFKEDINRVEIDVTEFLHDLIQKRIIVLE